MTKIILARHGQDEDNAMGILNGRRDKPLTSIGVKQAYDLAHKLKEADVNIGYVFSSHLDRALHTAKICSDILGVRHLAMDCLVERSHGILEGHHYSEISTMAKSYKNIHGVTYVLEVDGGETYEDLCKRAEGAIIEIKKKIIELEVIGDALVVSHGAISRAMTVVYQGLSHKEIFNEKSFSNCEFRVLD